MELILTLWCASELQVRAAGGGPGEGRDSEGDGRGGTHTPPKDSCCTEKTTEGITHNTSFDVKSHIGVFLHPSQVNKQKEEVILDHLHETAFQGTGLGRTILGPEVRLALPVIEQYTIHSLPYKIRGCDV